MLLLTLGVNHKTAPVEIREKVTFAPESLPVALRDLTSNSAISEAVILSTCNRTELYCGVDTLDSSLVIDWFQEYHNLDRGRVLPYLYSHPGKDAVRHTLRVASGLDSMVLGEPQILGQMKEAYSTASHVGTIGKLLGRLFQHTFSVAKQVRTDTAIGASPVSVAFAAVNLAKQIFSDFHQQSVLLIGAGQTIELAARHFHDNNIGRMIIANRTVEKAQKLAKEFHAYAISLSDIGHHLKEADIVLSSTASTLPILGKGLVESAIAARKHKPILMVDIAVPRDIEPEVGKLEDIYLYTVDDLQEIIEEGLKSRQEAAKQAEEIIDTQVAQFMDWLRSLDAVSTIRTYREQIERIKEFELEKSLRQLASGASPDAVIKQFAHRLMNKLSHSPSTQLRQAGIEGRNDIIKVAQELFKLKESDKEDT